MSLILTPYDVPKPKPVLSPEDRNALIRQLADYDYRPPSDVDDEWTRMIDVQKHNRIPGKLWACHVAVRILARACNDMGLRTEEVTAAIHTQRDRGLAEYQLIVLPRNGARAQELINFLTDRVEAPRSIERRLQRTWDLDKPAAAYCAVRVLAILCAREPFTTIDAHECIRQVRDRAHGVAGAGERASIWMPAER